jgi:hypothetical protein
VVIDAFGRLYNEAGEVVAEGNCQIDVERGTVTLRPLIDSPLISRQTGVLRLEVEDGTEYSLTERAIRFRLNLPGQPAGFAYRLTMVGSQPRRAAGDGSS